MIYGPYSSGWRDDETEKARRSSRRWALVGLLALAASGAAWCWLAVAVGVL